jgi:hypothetical protein
MQSDTFIYGLLGRIHVLMRRQLNRITDVEYMRINGDYAREIVRIGEAAGNEELAELCARLSAAMDLNSAAEATLLRAKVGRDGFSEMLLHREARHGSGEEREERYVSSLR